MAGQHSGQLRSWHPKFDNQPKLRHQTRVARHVVRVAHQSGCYRNPSRRTAPQVLKDTTLIFFDKPFQFLVGTENLERRRKWSNNLLVLCVDMPGARCCVERGLVPLNSILSSSCLLLLFCTLPRFISSSSIQSDGVWTLPSGDTLLGEGWAAAARRIATEQTGLGVAAVVGIKGG